LPGEVGAREIKSFFIKGKKIFRFYFHKKVISRIRESVDIKKIKGIFDNTIKFYGGGVDEYFTK